MDSGKVSNKKGAWKLLLEGLARREQPSECGEQESIESQSD